MAFSFKKIFLEDEDPSEAAKPGTAPAPTAAPKSAAAPPPIVTIDQTRTAQIDKSIESQLLEDVFKAGVPAFKALVDILDSLEDVMPDPKVRYKKALEILDKQGHKAPLLLTDIDKAIGALQDSARVFEKRQKDRAQATVGTLTRSVETTNQQIATKEAQVKQLNQEIGELQAKRDADQASITTSQAEIDHVQGRFDIVYKSATDEIQAQRAAVAAQMGQ